MRSCVFYNSTGGSVVNRIGTWMEKRIGSGVIVMTRGGLRVRRKRRLGQACYQR